MTFSTFFLKAYRHHPTPLPLLSDPHSAHLASDSKLQIVSAQGTASLALDLRPTSAASSLAHHHYCCRSGSRAPQIILLPYLRTGPNRQARTPWHRASHLSERPTTPAGACGSQTAVVMSGTTFATMPNDKPGRRPSKTSIGSASPPTYPNNPKPRPHSTQQRTVSPSTVTSSPLMAIGRASTADRCFSFPA